MTWWTATSVSINNNANIVVVNAADNIGLINDGDALVLAGQIVEIERAYFDNNNAPRILLKFNWTAGNQVNQPAKALPIPADLRRAVQYLRDVGQDAVTFSEAMAQILSSTAATLVIPTATSGDISVVPYGRLVQQVNALLATMGDFGVPLYDTDTKNQARTLLGLQPQTLAQPTIDFDFTNNQYFVYEPFGLTRKTLVEAITTARNSAAGYDSPFGVATAAANIPRITYAPVTGECLGLLCEELRTNLLLWSEQLTNTSFWTLSTASVVSTLDSAFLNIPVFKITPSSGATSGGVATPNIVSAKNSTYSATCLVKAAGYNFVFLQLNAFGGNNIRCFLNLITGELSAVQSGTASGVSASATNLGAGVWRVRLTGMPSSESTNNVQFSVLAANSINSATLSDADGVKSILVTACQLEIGSFPTSYIKTEDSQVTRAFERNFSNLTVNLNAMTLYAELNHVTIGLNNQWTDLITLSDLASTGFRGFSIQCDDNEVRAIYRNGSDSNGTIPIIALLPGQKITKIAAYFDLSTNMVLISLNGRIIKTALNLTAAITNPSFLNVLYIGDRGTVTGGQRFGRSSIFKNVRVYPRALSDQELIELTRL